jgi:hypothetical protein
MRRHIVFIFLDTYICYCDFQITVCTWSISSFLTLQVPNSMYVDFYKMKDNGETVSLSSAVDCRFYPQ